MAEKKRITTPLSAEVVRDLKAGDSVLITGIVYSARDAAHKVMTEALARGEKLPIDWNNQIVYKTLQADIPCIAPIYAVYKQDFNHIRLSHILRLLK